MVGNTATIRKGATVFAQSVIPLRDYDKGSAMSNIITQKMQFGKRLETVYRCNCGEDSFLIVAKAWEGEEGTEYYVAVTHSPSSLKQRFKEAWRALRGYENTVSNEVILSTEQLKDLADDLQKLVGIDGEWMERARTNDTCCVPGCPGKNFPYCLTHE